MDCSPPGSSVHIGRWKNFYYFGDGNRKKWGGETFTTSTPTQSDLQKRKPLDLDQKSPHRASGETLASYLCVGVGHCIMTKSILKEISPEYSLEGLMLKLKLQYLGHLIRRTDSLWKTLMLGKMEGRRGMGWQRMRWLDGITNLMDLSLSKLPGVGDGQGSLACCSPWGCKESDTTERLNWTELLLNTQHP